MKKNVKKLLIIFLFWFFIILIYFLLIQKNTLQSENEISLKLPLKNPNKLKSKQIINPDKIHYSQFNYLKYIEKTKIKQNGDLFEKHKFNLKVSDDIGMVRNLPETMSSDCKKINYDVTGLPMATIIITFHNEARSALIRTVASILDKSSEFLIEEIILIDDFSQDPSDGEELKIINKVRVIRNQARQGLIKSRVKGATVAKSAILIFLDSHCECNEGWLEPLLYYVTMNQSAVVSPVIDVINTDNFNYQATPTSLIGGFDWNMVFKWQLMDSKSLQDHYHNPALPLKTPVIAGGLFAINKNFFFKIGKYDINMEIWGGENIELSLRVWQCHGLLWILPCSRVGHVFRKQHPYSFPGGSGKVVTRNLRRVVEVWLDDYKKYYYETIPIALHIPFGNINSRQKLRKDLKCKSFDWYIKNIYPSLKIPENNIIGIGSLEVKFDMNFDLDSNNLFDPINLFNSTNHAPKTNPILTSWCLDSLGIRSRSKSRSPKVIQCHYKGGNQDWILTNNMKIKQNNLCLTLTSFKTGSSVILNQCKDNDEKQFWIINKKSKFQIKTKNKNLCLKVNKNLETGLVIDICNSSHPSQWWFFNLKQY